MEKIFQFKRCTIKINDNEITIKQVFLGETFMLKDLIDVQLLDNELYIMTRRNQFKVKYTENQKQSATEVYKILSGNPNYVPDDKSVSHIKVNYLGGHPQMAEEGWAEMDIRTQRLIVTTFQRSAYIEYKNIKKIHYENEVQLIKRLPIERLSLLNTLSVHLRSQPNSSKYYFTIDFLNNIGDKFCAVYGGKEAKQGYEILKQLLEE